ncbi:Zinc finger MYM-type protein 6, partial [Stegodyphus mimosarum]
MYSSYGIQCVAQNLNHQLMEKIKENGLGQQLDESTDSNKDANLIHYVLSLNDNIEDIVFCKSIIGSAKVQDLFKVLDKFIMGNDLDWKKCICVCTDGTQSMNGRYAGL